MRKVTQQIATAFAEGKSKTVGNTRTDGTSVWLHGNKIVERREDGIFWTLAGWDTVTTRDRVNGIANAGVYQQKFKQFVDGVAIDIFEWRKA